MTEPWDSGFPSTPVLAEHRRRPTALGRASFRAKKKVVSPCSAVDACSQLLLSAMALALCRDGRLRDCEHAQHEIQFHGRHWFGVQISLHVVAAHLDQCAALRFEFDALSNAGHSKSARDINDALHQGSSGTFCRQPIDKGFVDLDNLKGQVSESTQRRIAGAVVVNGEPDPQGSQHVDAAEADLALEKNGTLRDLQHQ